MPASWKASLALLGLGVALVAPWARADDAAPEEDYSEDDIEDEILSSGQLEKLHGKFDANGDGKVGLSEMLTFSKKMVSDIAQKDVQAIFEEVDTSKDGRLSLEEHMTDLHNQADGGDEQEMKELEARKRLETEKFKAADQNNDGHLDSKEIPALFYPEVDEAVLTITVREAMEKKDDSKDGKLTPMEFWEVTEAEQDLSEEEQADFKKLDANSDGLIDMEELRAWESGRFHTEDAMRKLLEVADKDHDMHVTVQELVNAREEVAASDAHYHLMEWSEHHEL